MRKILLNDRITLKENKIIYINFTFLAILYFIYNMKDTVLTYSCALRNMTFPRNKKVHNPANSSFRNGGRIKTLLY